MINAIAIFFFLFAYLFGRYDYTGVMLSCCVIGFAILCLNPKNKQECNGIEEADFEDKK